MFQMLHMCSKDRCLMVDKLVFLQDRSVDRFEDLQGLYLSW